MNAANVLNPWLKLCGWLFAWVLLLQSTVTIAQEDAPNILRVGTKEAAPFAIRHEDGSWSGISIELWRAVANDLGLRYEFVELPLDEILSRLESGDLDVGVAAITITHERERRIDFSHSYFNTGLGIAVVPRQGSGWPAVIRRVFSAVFLEFVVGILFVLLISGILVYLFERKRNCESFGQGAAKGIANGIWWAAVTMTTVGYGDKVPKTAGGRVIAVVWMFSAIIIISMFTASVTSVLTLSQLESSVRGPHDLRHTRVAAVADSTSSQYLLRQGFAFQSHNSVDECLEALTQNKVGAVVYDAPILRYVVHRDFPGAIHVLSATFERQDYAIALPVDSRLRERINQAMLQSLSRPEWNETLHRYLGN